MAVFRFILSSSLLLLATVAHARTITDHRDPSLEGSAHVLQAVTPVFETFVTRTAGQTTTCETRNLSPNADPVLHVLTGATGNGTVAELARDDDSGGNLSARVTFQAPVSGVYRIILHAAGSGAGGRAQVFCDGTPASAPITFGGAFKRLENVRDHETLTTLPLPGGPHAHKLYLLDSAGRMVQRHESGPTEGVVVALARAAVLTAVVGAPAATPVVGTGTLRARVRVPDSATTGAVVGIGGFGAAPPGDLRLVRNDNLVSGHDPDGDGLGIEVEKRIGTCSTRTGLAGNWECSRAIDPRDTDGDGIPDGTELLGLLTSPPFQWLPRWGADPRHKDLFIEVDFRLSARGEAPQKLSRDKALEIARIYGDSEENALFRLAHAQALNNPDLQAGIRLHLDTGVPSTAKDELTIYGDWGGFTAVAPFCDDPVIVARRLRSRVDDVRPPVKCVAADVGQVWQTRMEFNRRGIFTYALGYPGGGGQASIHTFVLNFPMGHAPTAAHELGHTLGLDHNGPADVGPGANCKPNYPSLMSYAYLGHPAFSPDTFSDGYGRSSITNVQLIERGAVAQPASGPGRKYLTHLRDVFGFNVDMAAGHVDWDRDGVFSASPVRAYANNDHGDCEFTRANQMYTTGTTDGAPTLTRMGPHTIILYTHDDGAVIARRALGAGEAFSFSKLHMEFTDDSLACPSLGVGCGPPLTNRAINESWNQGVLTFDAHPVTIGGERKLLVVFRTGAGLFETTMSSAFAWSAPAPIQISSPAVGEFSLAGDGALAWLAFKNAQGNVVIKARNAAGAWSADEPALDGAGTAIGPLAANGAPAILHAAFADGRRVLLGAFALRGALQLFEKDVAAARWQRSAWPVIPEAVFGRPALAFEPVGAGSPLPGRLRLLYMLQGTNHIVRSQVLEAVGIGPAAQLKVSGEYHDNVWLYSVGVDLLFEPGVDTNLRAAVVMALIEKGKPTPHVIALRPKADGIVHFVQRNWNDWEGLGVDLCRTRKKAGAQVNCLPWPFTVAVQPPPPPGPQPPQPTPPAQSRTQCLQLCRADYDDCAATSAGNTRACRPLLQTCRAECQQF